MRKRRGPISIVSIYLTLLFITVAVVSCAAKNKLDYEMGFAKFESEELDEATVIFQQIVQKGGVYADRARYYIAENHRLHARWDEAIEQFQIVSDADPNGLPGAAARSRIAQIKQGRTEIEQISIASVGHSDTSELVTSALLKLGLIFEDKLEDYDSAINAYQVLIKEFPGAPKAAQAQINIGNIYMYKLYDYTKGFEELKKVNVENYPGQEALAKEAEDSLRSFNRISRKIKESQASIRKSLERRPIEPGSVIVGMAPSIIVDTHTNAHIDIGKGWRELKNYPRAIGAYKLLIERHPLMLVYVDDAGFSIAEIYQHDQKRYLEAIDAYHKYLDRHFANLRGDEAIYNLAVCYEALEMYDNAYEKYEEYCANYPEGKLFRSAEARRRKCKSEVLLAH